MTSYFPSVAGRTQPVPWSEVERALYEWVRDVTGVVVIWRNQTVPQPPYPFCSILRQSTRHVGGRRERVHRYDAAEDELEIAVIGHVEFTLNVQCLTDRRASPEQDAVHLLSLLTGSIDLESTRGRLCAAELSHVFEGTIDDVSDVVNAEYISRASVDVGFRVPAVVTERLPYIETVELQSPGPPAVISETIPD